MKIHTLKKSCLGLVVYLLTFLYLHGQEQRIPSKGFLKLPNKNLSDSTLKKQSSSLSNTNKILFKGPGIVLYDDYFPSASEVRAEGGCTKPDNPSSNFYSKCGAFTVPENHPLSIVDPQGYVFFDGLFCGNSGIYWSLQNSAGEDITEKPYVMAGQTYKYCLETTTPSFWCSVSSICLSPSLIKVSSSVQHYYVNKNQKKLLRTQSDSSSKEEYFAVCADGSDVSVFKFFGGGYDYNNINVRIKENTANDPELYGQFTIIHKNKDSLTVKYKHPEYIKGSGKSATYILEMFDTITNSSTSLATNKLEVYRAPIVFVHGLKANRSTFQEMESFLTNFGLFDSQLIYRVDYSSTNIASFSSNRNIVADAIKLHLNYLCSSNIAAGKVVCIGHSMGGVLSRIYLQNSSTEPYRGDIQKLITVNTPHSGSHLPCLLTDPDLPGIQINILAVLARLNQVFWCDNCEALTNLGVESEATRVLLNGVNNLNKNIVPTHAVSTYKLSAFNDLLKQLINGKLALLPIDYILFNQLGKNPDGIFGELNDCAVSYTSQRGGLSWNCITTIEDEIHVGATNNIRVITKIINLLKESPLSASFCQDGFHPPTLSCNYVTKNKIIKASQNLADPLTISIESPERGAFIFNNDYFGLKISGTNITEINAYMSHGKDSVYIGKFSGNKVFFNVNDYKIPLERDVIVIGKNTESTTSISVKDSFCESLNGGNWNDSSIWSCGKIPGENDIVILNKNHLISIQGNYKVKAVIYNGGKVKIIQGSLVIKDK